MSGALAAAGDIGSSVVSGLFGQASARDARHFEANMSSTAYQRAAVDLEKAGLNRILALGSPASTPSSPVASMPDAHAGSSYTAGSTAKTVQNVNNETVNLLKEQQRKTRFEGDAAAEQAANIRADTALKTGNTGLIPWMRNEIEERTKTYPSTVNLQKYQSENYQSSSRNLDAGTRVKGIEGDTLEVQKLFYELVAPLARDLIDRFHGGGSAKRPSGPVPWWPGSSNGATGKW